MSCWTPRAFAGSAGLRRLLTGARGIRARTRRRASREQVLEPLNQSGDREGARWSAGRRDHARRDSRRPTRSTWKAAGRSSARIRSTAGSPCRTALGSGVRELWGSANLSFKLCPMLTHRRRRGAAAVRLARAEDRVPAEDGERRVDRHHGAHRAAGGLGSRPHPHARGARGRSLPRCSARRFSSPGAITTARTTSFTWCWRASKARPPGTRGISLFIVPKLLVNDDGSLGERNEVRCVSIEHKLGIHASPTCMLAFGDDKGAIALSHRRAESRARVHVHHDECRAPVGGRRGLRRRGARVSARAEWARTRVQGKPPVAAASGPAPIIHHPDVKRMLLTMKSSDEAMRALALYAAFQLDLAEHHAEEKRARSRADARGAADSRREGLVHRARQRDRRTSACRSTAAWDSSRRPAPRSTCATFASPRSTKARPASRRTICIGRKIGRDGGAAMTALHRGHEARARSAAPRATPPRRPPSVPRSKGWRC